VSHPTTFAAVNEAELASTLNEILETTGLQDLVGVYLRDPAHTGFAGALFDTYGNNAPGRFTGDDIAAVSLLDVRFGAKAFSGLLVSGDELNESLAAIDAKANLWDANAPLGELRALYDRLKRLDGVGPTKASKLLARKRPHLAPITDSVVDAVLDSDGWSHLGNLALVLRTHQDLRARLIELSKLAPQPISPLRALDISIWMLGSNSGPAKGARVAAGLSREPLRHPNRRPDSHPSGERH